MKKLSVILPCYNEEESLPIYFQAVDEVLPKIKDRYDVEFVLVNDGSKDKTLQVMNDLYGKRDDVVVVSLSRNYGQNSAFSAGLKVARGDYVITMDADLQDPVTLIPEMMTKFEEGYDVINPHRVNRKKDSAFKRETAGLFYRIINKLEGKPTIPENVNCFRGMTRRVVDHILDLDESDRYLLSEIPLMGYKTYTLDFTREERKAGKSKYNIPKMVKYALDNMSSATSKPLYWATFFSVIMGIFSLGFFLAMLVCFILCCCGMTVLPSFGFYTTMFILSSILLGSSIVIFFIGLLGIYLHNILINTRHRPNYIIEEVLTPEEKHKETKE